MNTINIEIVPKGNTKGSDWPQIAVILACSFTSLSNGLLAAWTSPSIPQLIADSGGSISLEKASYLTVISPVAMVVAAPLVAYIVENYGRKIGVLLVGIPQLLSWILAAAGTNIWIYYASRVMTGIADTAYFGSVPAYICEISRPSVRGVWGNAATFCVYFGFFLINVIGAYNDIRTTALICSCTPIIHLIIFWVMPESPYYLLKRGNEKEARKALMTLRWTNDVEQELMLLKVDVQRQISERGHMKDLFKIKSNRKALFIAVIVRGGQQFTGLPAFETYTQYMFKQAGGDVSEKTSSIVFSGILFVCVACSTYVVELVGRKPLMLFSCLGCGIVSALLTSYFFIDQYSTIDTSIVSWIPLVGMSVYIIIFSPGLGIVPGLLLGELFSVSITGKALSVVNIVVAVSDIIVPKLFETLTYSYGIGLPFLLFTINCFVCVVLVYLYMIETKGKTLEEIQQELRGNIKGIS